MLKLNASRKRAMRIVLIPVLILFLAANTKSVSGYHDWLTVNFRVDQNDVVYSQDYILNILPVSFTSSAPVGFFTTAWLSVNLSPSGGGSGGKSDFTQVGYMSDNRGMYWFVYSEKQNVECLQGTSRWGTRGCTGSVGSLANTGVWHQVELVTYQQGFWIARVYDDYGNAEDVAKISSSSARIYKATASFEEGFNSIPDPHYRGSFFSSYPKYMIWGTGFANWPASDNSTANTLSNVSDLAYNNFCPTYYNAVLNWNNNPRVWYFGTAGMQNPTCTSNIVF
ncbi:MAG: hypothetical protein WA110_08645 [Anaerolineaceae bacterium]